MDATVSFSWHALYRADEAPFDRLMTTPIIKLVEVEQYFNRISAKSPTLYHPIDISWTNLFHNRLRQAIRTKFNIEVKEKNFPYNIDIMSLGGVCRIGVSAQYFIPNILSIRLTCYTRFDLDEDNVFSLRQLSRHPELIFIAGEVVNIISRSLFGVNYFKKKNVKPIMNVIVNSTNSDYIHSNRGYFCALLINDKNFRASSPKMWEKIFLENEEHNRKNERGKLILISKQSFLSILNSASMNDQLTQQEIKKREKMFELGYVLQTFFEDYPSMRQESMREMDYLFFATQRYIKEPELTFSLSYGNTLAWDVIVNSLRLKEAFRASTRFNVDAESKLSNLFDKIPHPRYTNPDFWRQVRKALGENYVTNSTPQNKFNIGTMNGSISTGDNSPALTVNISRQTKEESLSIIEKLAQIRNELPEGQVREEFDEAIVSIRSEIKSSEPNNSRISNLLSRLMSFSESVASNVVAGGLVEQLGKLLG